MVPSCLKFTNYIFKKSTIKDVNKISSTQNNGRVENDQERKRPLTLLLKTQKGFREAKKNFALRRKYTCKQKSGKCITNNGRQITEKKSHSGAVLLRTLDRTGRRTSIRCMR